jgi:hypothetical protein
VRRAGNLATTICLLTRNAGCLNPLEPEGPVVACIGIAEPLPLSCAALPYLKIFFATNCRLHDANCQTNFKTINLHKCTKTINLHKFTKTINLHKCTKTINLHKCTKTINLHKCTTVRTNGHAKPRYSKLKKKFLP